MLVLEQWPTLYRRLLMLKIITLIDQVFTRRQGDILEVSTCVSSIHEQQIKGTITYVSNIHNKALVKKEVLEKLTEIIMLSIVCFI